MAVTNTYDRADLFALTRATKGWRFDPVGTLADVAAGEVRIDYDPATLAWRGWLIEQAVTNQVTNPLFEGGVAGAPGTMPTGMSVVLVAGISSQVVAIAADDGIASLALRLSGTPSATGFCRIVLRPSTGAGAVAGETWTVAAAVSLVAGALTNISSTRLRVLDYSGAGALLNGSTQTFTPIASSLRTAILSTTRVLASGTTANVGADVAVGVTSGAPIDVTLRIGMPQLVKEPLAFSPSFPPAGAPAAFTRNADDLSLTTISRWLDPAKGTFCIDFMPGQTTAPADRGLLLLDDGTTDNRIRLRMLAASTNVRLSVDGAGAPIVATLDTTSGAALTRHTVRFSYGPAGYVLSVNGAAPVTASGAVPDGLARALLGRSLTSSEYLNGWLGPRFDYFPQQYTDTAAADGFTIRNR